MTRTRLIPAIVTVFTLALGLFISPASAQNLFAPVIKVGDLVVTKYDLDQRTRMLELLNAPGDPGELAANQLIEDKLKLLASARYNLKIDAGELAAGKTEFAARANLSAEEFEKALAQSGVDVETLENFIVPGLLWRKVVAGRFNNLVTITDRDVDNALTNAANGENVRVLISEIFIAAPPGQEAAAMERARAIAKNPSIAAFAAAARQYSAAPSGRAGGRVNWIALTELPANLRAILMGLKPGGVSQPLSIPGAVALFQLRAIEEGDFEPRKVTGLEYAAYYIPGGRSEAALATAAKLKANVDVCDDLYGAAHGQPASVLDRGLKKPGEIPQDVAYELAKLDANEVSTNLTRANGETLVFLMLCKRETELVEGVDREQIRTQLQNQAIENHAKGLLEQLRSETRIVVY